MCHLFLFIDCSWKYWKSYVLSSHWHVEKKQKWGNQRRSRDAGGGGALRLRRPVAAQRRSRSQQLHGGKKKNPWERRRITVHSSIYGADLRIWCHRIRVSSYGAYMNKSPRKRRRWTVFLGWRKRAVHHCLRRNKNGLDVEGKWGFLFHIHYSQKGEKQEKHIRS